MLHQVIPWNHHPRGFSPASVKICLPFSQYFCSSILRPDQLVWRVNYRQQGDWPGQFASMDFDLPDILQTCFSPACQTQPLKGAKQLLVSTGPYALYSLPQLLHHLSSVSHELCSRSTGYFSQNLRA